MTQNLRIQNYTLKSNDSDVVSDFILPASNLWQTTNCTGTSCHDISHVYIYNETGYYNFYTASAGDVTLDKLSGSGIYETKYSICPKGWSLPTKTEAENIASLYTASSIKQNPANFRETNQLYNGDFLNYPALGIWFTSYAVGSKNTYINGLQLMYYPPNYNDRILVMSGWNYGCNGDAVRCIKKNGT